MLLSSRNHDIMHPDRARRSVPRYFQRRCLCLISFRGVCELFLVVLLWWRTSRISWAQSRRIGHLLFLSGQSTNSFQDVCSFHPSCLEDLKTILVLTKVQVVIPINSSMPVLLQVAFLSLMCLAPDDTMLIVNRSFFNTLPITTRLLLSCLNRLSTSFRISLQLTKPCSRKRVSEPKSSVSLPSILVTLEDSSTFLMRTSPANIRMKRAWASSFAMSPSPSHRDLITRVLMTLPFQSPLARSQPSLEVRHHGLDTLFCPFLDFG